MSSIFGNLFLLDIYQMSHISCYKYKCTIICSILRYRMINLPAEKRAIDPTRLPPTRKVKHKKSQNWSDEGMYALQEKVEDVSFSQDHKIHARQKPQLKNQKYCQRKYMSIYLIVITMMIIGGVTLFSKYFPSPKIKTATTDDTIIACTCKDLFSGRWGNCHKKIDGKPLCDVELPSSCSDLQDSTSNAGEKWSFEACSQIVLGSPN